MQQQQQIKWYKFLKSKENNVGLLDTIDLLNEGEILIMKEESNHRSYACINKNMLFTILKQSKGKITLHEITRQQGTQKIYFDIDYHGRDFDGSIMQCIKDSICIVMNNLYQNYFQNTSIDSITHDHLFEIIGDGLDENGMWKCSRHILILPDMLNIMDNRINKFICEQVKSYIQDEQISNAIDSSVYSQNHGMRLPLTLKGNRMLKLPRSYRVGYWDQQTLFDLSLITYSTGSYTLPFHEKYNPTINEISDRIIIDSELQQQIIDYLKEKHRDLFNTYSVSICDNIINLKRIKSAYCEQCSRVHDSDGKYISIQKKQGKIYLKLFCRRGGNPLKLDSFKIKSERSDGNLQSKRSDGNLQSENSDEKNIHQMNDIQKILDFKKSNIFGSFGSELECYVKQHPKLSLICDQEFLPKYEQTKGVLLIKSGMGTGKTKQLIQFIQQRYKPIQDPRILFISFRQTYTDELKQKLNNGLQNLLFTSYKDRENSLVTDNLSIVQYESLHRIDSSIPFDLVVFDESESIIEQITAKTGLKGGECVCSLQKILQRNNDNEHPFVICQDAAMSNRTLRFIQSLKLDQPNIIINKYQHNKRDIILYQTKPTIISAINNSLLQGKKIVIATNSLNDAKSSHQWIKQNFPDLEILCYTSESNKESMVRDLSQPEQYMLQDVLIYSPTITAGVSIETKWYDDIFCMFSENSCNAYVCTQMIGRVRSISSNRLNLFVSNKKRELYEEQHILQAVGELFQNTMSYKIDDQSLYFKIWSWNNYINQLSLSNFLQELLYLLPIQTCQIYTSQDDSNDLMMDWKKNQKLMKKMEYELIAQSQTITEQEHIQLLKKQQTEYISQTEKNMLQKHKIKQLTLSTDQEVSNPNFIAKFGTKSCMQKLHNIKSIAHLCGKSQDQTRTIIIQNTNAYKILSDNLNHRYGANIRTKKDLDHGVKLAITISIQDIINLIGFDNTFDEKHISIELIQNQIQKNKKDIDYKLKLIARVNNNKHVKNEVESISNILMSIYGSKINEDQQNYWIQHSKKLIPIIQRMIQSINISQIE